MTSVTRQVDIAVIGAGQLGSRHLQALVSWSRPAEIRVVDPDPKALERAQASLQGRAFGSPETRVSYHAEIPGTTSSLDAAIIATTADVRLASLERLLESAKVPALILEKVLFQRPEDYEAARKLLRGASAKAWVNCPRRMWPFYQRLKGRIRPGERLRYLVSGSNFGLGCNAIHFLDHLAYLAGRGEFRLSGEGLDLGTIASKRPRFIEFTGALTGELSGGHTLEIRSSASGENPLTVEIESESLRCVVREDAGEASMAEAASGWTNREERFRAPFQSELTHLAVERILDQGTCDLTPYEESSSMHLELIKTLLSHLSAAGRPADVCPIT